MTVLLKTVTIQSISIVPFPYTTYIFISVSHPKRRSRCLLPTSKVCRVLECEDTGMFVVYPHLFERRITFLWQLFPAPCLHPSCFVKVHFLASFVNLFIEWLCNSATQLMFFSYYGQAPSVSKMKGRTETVHEKKMTGKCVLIINLHIA